MTDAKFPRVDLNPETSDPPLLAALRYYWMSKGLGRLMPSRHEIVPSEIKSHLPHVLLVDVIDGGRDFRYRLVGSRLHENFTSLPTGRLMSEMLEPFGAATVQGTLGAYRQVVTSKAPSRIRGSGAVYSQETKFFDSILMPLSDDGDTVNMIFGAFFFQWDRNHEFRDLAEDTADWSRALRTG